MTKKSLTASLLLLSAGLLAQNHSATPAAAETSAKAPTAQAYYYIDPSPLHLDRILPPPPSRNSAATTAELTELHRVEAARTPAQIHQAEADDKEEDIFIFKTVLGPGFTAEALPLTAALSAHVRKDESAADSPLKKIYGRPRPYQIDSTLHPVCQLNSEPTSYPSGHSLSGYLLAFTLVQPSYRRSVSRFSTAPTSTFHNRLIWWSSLRQRNPGQPHGRQRHLRYTHSNTQISTGPGGRFRRNPPQTRPATRLAAAIERHATSSTTCFRTSFISHHWLLTGGNP